MKISTVRIKNFRGYGINPNSNDGFFCFNNLDNADFLLLNGFNGFGKTSFFEAIEWCLTNSVRRLKNLEDNVDNKASLNSNSYLIFIPEDGSERKAEVEIKFSSGEIIKRSTIAKSLHSPQYDSQTELYCNNKSINVREDLISGISLRKLYNINFLGQETILDLLKKDRPSERSSKFLNLINLSELNKIEEKSSLRNFSFVSEIKKLNDKNKELEDAKTKTDRFFAQKDWKSIDEFIQKINEEKDLLKVLKGSLKVKASKEWLSLEFINVEITNKNCFDYIENISAKAQKVSKRNIELIQEKKNKEDYDLCVSAITLYKENQKLEFLRGIAITAQSRLLGIYEAALENNNAKTSALDALKKLTQKFKNVWINYKDEKCNIDDILKVFKISVSSLQSSVDETLLFKNFFTENISDAQRSIFKSEEIEKISYDISNVIKTYNSIKLVELNDYINEYKLSKNRLESNLKLKNNQLKELSKLNENFTKLLGDVKLYINGTKEINECPVCLNSDFSKSKGLILSDEISKKTIKEQLIAIIDNQVSNGNDQVQKVINIIGELEKNLLKERIDIEQRINKEFIQIVDSLKDGYSSLVIFIESIIDDNYSQVRKCEKSILPKKLELVDRINSYKKQYKEIFGEEFNIHTDIKMIDEKVIQENNAKINIIKEKINVDSERVSSHEDFIQLRNSLKNNLSSDSVKFLTDKISDLNSIVIAMNEFRKFDVSENDRVYIVKSVNYEKQSKILKDEIVKIEKDMAVVKLINKNTGDQKKAILEVLFKNKLIKHIYNEINPHYRFKDLEIENKVNVKKSQSNFKSGDIYLNQIFSSAQLNTISLSVFLGMGIPEKGSKLDQLFLDDPIQSMDDLNILALIDIFRSLIDAKKAKRLIVSTHDDDFAKLLKIKMRNKNVKVINFISYGSEGPIIECS